MNKIAIFAYGSLIEDPREPIKSHIFERIPHISPFKVEYARSSTTRGGGATLVIYPGGGNVQGQILLLDLIYSEANLRLVMEWVRRREKTKSEWIKYMRVGDYNHVIYCDIASNIEPNPQLLAEKSIESVRKCKLKGEPDKNGIRYLIEKIKDGVITPLTEEYKNEILRLTKTKRLEEAEQKLLQK